MDKGLRRVTAIAVALVGIAAACLSFRHQMDLAAGHGETPMSAWLLPVLTDGAIIVGTVALLVAAREGHSAHWARCITGAGISLSVLFNVVHGASWGWLGVIIAGWPPLALVLAVETLAGMLRRRENDRGLSNDHGNVTGEKNGKVCHLSQSVAEPSQELIESCSISDDAPEPAPAPAPAYASNGHSADAHLVMRECSGDAVPSLREIQRTLSCGQAKAQRIQGECREMRELAAEMR